LLRRPTPQETIGLVLLGLALYSLALALRQSQPGLVNAPVPPWVWPAAVGVVYVGVSLVATGARLARAAALLGALVFAHVVYALLMGLAFAVESQGPGGLSAAPLTAGLTSYPPATFLQAAFVIPLCCTLLGPRRESPNCSGVGDAGNDSGSESGEAHE
jgi:hypothetical protein